MSKLKLKKIPLEGMSSYAFKLFEAGFVKESHSLLQLPLRHGVFFRRRKIKESTSKEFAKKLRLFDESMPKPQTVLKGTRVAITVNLLGGPDGSHEDPWVNDFYLVYPYIKILDYGVSLDFLVATVKWLDAVESFHEKNMSGKDILLFLSKGGALEPSDPIISAAAKYENYINRYTNLDKLPPPEAKNRPELKLMSIITNQLL